MQLTFAAALAVLAFTASAAPTVSNHVVHEKRAAATSWIRRRAVPAGQLLPVRIGMTQRNLDIVHDMMMDLASHDSPNYGKWYSQQEIHDLFAPSDDTVTALKKWLNSHGIDHISQSHNKQWLQFDIAAEKLEDLLATKYFEYEHPENGVVMPACDQYHVPAHVQEHIDFITPGIKLSTSGRRSGAQLRKRGLHTSLPIIEGAPPANVLAQVGKSNLTYCDEIITPECIMALYNISAPTTSVAGNELGIFESDGQYYSQQDLNNYFGLFAPWVPVGTKPTLNGVDGGGSHGTIPASQADAGDEADLDFEASIPLIHPQSTVLWQVDDPYYEASGTYSGFLNNLWDAIDGSYCTYSAFGETGNAPGIDPPYPDNHTDGYQHKLQCGAYTPTNVISISYHAIENELPVNYQRRACNEIMKLSMQGVTVVGSSGDHGVQEEDDGTYCIGGKIFAPQFPVTCPYVLAVGATVLPLGKKNPTKDAEIAVTRFASGGGFSNIFASPAYQSSAVNKFFNKHDPPYPYYTTTNNESVGTNGGLYNRGGRGYPDVSAIGDNFAAFIGGESVLIGGTSLSAPVFASIITRINEERLLAGKSTVGWINPALYANPSMFHDITEGTNPGCNTTGFESVPGWDPLTGLGTPRFGDMMDYFLSLP